MKRKIVGFHLDHRREWVAELECGHGQHVRHNPPFQDRAWVLSAEDRANYVGVLVECHLCAGTRRPSTSPQKRQKPKGS